MRPAVEEARAAAARSTLCRIGAVRRAGALGWGSGDAGPWAEALRVAPEDPSPRLLQRPPAASGSPAQLRRRDRPGPVDPPEPADPDGRAVSSLFGGSRLPLAGSNENRRLIRAEGKRGPNDGCCRMRDVPYAPLWSGR
jgi:hypothetical protein